MIRFLSTIAAPRQVLTIRSGFFIRKMRTQLDDSCVTRGLRTRHENKARDAKLP